MLKDLNNVWLDSFNERNNDYHITRILLSDSSSCVYQLDDNKELRITLNPRMYDFSKRLKSRQYKHVAEIYDCFTAVLPDQHDEEQHVFCIVSESINRNFLPRTKIQSAINIFRNIWSDYLKSSHHLDFLSDVAIEKAYAAKDNDGRKYVLDRIRLSEYDNEIKNIVIALNDTYRKIKRLDPHSAIYLLAENIGLSEDSVIKMCNISYDCIGLDENYEIDSNRNSVTITYNPLISKDYVRDNRMLVPLKVDFGNGNLLPVLGQIDTGAASSGFTEELFERASLINLGKTKIGGSTGVKDAYKTMCEVTFPNGFKTTLWGHTITKLNDVSILIGMDLLSFCKFESEPYCNGFRYKITFQLSPR